MSVAFVTNLKKKEKSTSCAEATPIRLRVTWYQRLNILSNFSEIRLRNSLQKKLYQDGIS